MLSLLLPQVTINPKTPIFQFLSSSSSSSLLSSGFTVRAVEKESQKFEIDPDEAKQALKKLDQQLKALSKKQTSSPRIKAADVKLTRDQEAENPLDISGPLLANTAVALLIFTIFYNILFYSVIKPSVDGPDDAPAQSPEAAVLQLPPPAMEEIN